MTRRAAPQYGPHPVDLDAWRERARCAKHNHMVGVGAQAAMRLLFELLDAAEGREVSR